MENTQSIGKREGFILASGGVERSHAYYLKEACKYATLHSDDQDTKNGAILVCGDKVVYAANMMPSAMVKATDERTSRPLKYQFIEHAERTALLRAAASGIKTQGATLYCPWYACVDCARAIIVAGIKEVVGVKKVMDATPERWSETIGTANLMLSEAGVIMTYAEDTLGTTMVFGGSTIDL